MRLPRGLVRVFNRFGNMTTTHRYDEPIPVVVGRVGASPEEVHAVSEQHPLPVVVGASPTNPLLVDLVNKETRARNVDLLLLHTTTVNPQASQADLYGNASSELATIGSAGQYRTLLWTGVKNHADPVRYRIFARTTDADGQPFPGASPNWIELTDPANPPQITGAANAYFRVVIAQTDGLYYDQYRIVVYRDGTNAITLHSKIVGVRG